MSDARERLPDLSGRGHLAVRSQLPQKAWWLVLCLVGLDYFSTLAYLPSLAVEAAGVLAPLATLLVMVVTLCVALPVYCYVVGKSPNGRGGIGVLEKLVSGWTGKLTVLFLLAFIATDFVVTRNLSVADASEHVRANPWFREALTHLTSIPIHPREWWQAPLWQKAIDICDKQLTLTLALSMLSFGLWRFWRDGDAAKSFLTLAAVVVGIYMLVAGIVIVSGLYYLQHSGAELLNAWYTKLLEQASGLGDDGPSAWRLLTLTLVAFPHLALGLSGFELSMAVVPLVRGAPDDTPAEPRGRIKNARKLFMTGALLMAVYLPGAVFISTLLVPGEEFRPGGLATHRALAYLAHGGMLADNQSASMMCPLFGPAFGTLYDVAAICILCLAGASVTIGLCDFVPEYLMQYGMELEWAHEVGLKMRSFNLIILAVALVFHASVTALQWVYATSVLVLLAGAALAAVVNLRHDWRGSRWRPLVVGPALLAFLFFITMACTTIVISRAGLETAMAFVVGIFGMSLLSRWIRSTELRFSGFAFTDDESRRLWDDLCGAPFEVLVPHRPGLISRKGKEDLIRRRHRIPADVPVVIIEAELGDTSNFYQAPLMKIAWEEGQLVIHVRHCVSISHVVAAIALEMGRVGAPPEVHFGWSDEPPLAANLKFLLFGEGNIPWMVRALLRKAEPDADRRPQVMVG